MSLFLTLVHIIVILAISFRVWKAQTALRKVFWPALIIKFIAGICLGLVYLHYYSVADTFDYFRDASKFAALAMQDFPSYLEVLFFEQHLDKLDLIFYQPRAVFMTRITSIFSILTHNNYWIIGFYFSLISFLASWNLVQVIRRNIPSVTTAGVLAFLFVPSVVFWSSGLLKESLALAALYFLSALFIKIWFQRKSSLLEYLTALIALIVFWKLKYYYVAIFMPVILTSLFYRFAIRRREISSPWVEISVWGGILVLPLLMTMMVHPNFHPERFLDVIVGNNVAYYELSAPEDVVRFNDLQATPASLLKNSPWALFSGLFRPLVWESSVAIQILPGIENTILLLLFLTGTSGFKKYFSSPYRLLIFTLIAYVILLCVLITISAPNFGTLSRYRIGYLPFFVFIILCNHPVMRYLERSFLRLVRD